MWQFAILLIVLLACAESVPYSNNLFSAASPAQIRFAIENKYDDTGPGAKAPEYAYKTFKHIDDALVAYLNDPDTKLPEHEKFRALNKLHGPYHYNFIDDVPKRVDAFTGHQHKIVPVVLSRYNKYDLGETKAPSLYENLLTKHDPIRWHKEQSVKASRLSISHYNKEADPIAQDAFHYPVLKQSGPRVRSTQEVRDGRGAVHGYYTVAEPDGRRRTVQYQNDPSRGFQASVQRVFRFDGADGEK